VRACVRKREREIGGMLLVLRSHIHSVWSENALMEIACCVKEDTK